MNKLICLFIISGIVQTTSAQEFVIDASKRKDDFAQDLIFILNSAPYKYSFVKGKPINMIDSLHPKAKMFSSKIKLKGAVSGKIETDSSFSFIEFFFPDIKQQDEAEAAYSNLINKVNEALRKKVLFKKNENDTTGFLKQTKIAYASHSGFFNFNINILLNKINKPDRYQLKLHIDGGKPKYFYRIFKNEPIASFILLSAAKQSIIDFENDLVIKNCLGDLPMFECIGKRMKGDTMMISYNKNLWHDLPNAKTEFDATLTNLRGAFSNEYVYSMSQPYGNILKEAIFVKYDDLDKAVHKKVQVDLIQKVNKSYSVEINFVY